MIIHLQHLDDRGSLCGLNRLSTVTTDNYEEVTCKMCLRKIGTLTDEKRNRYHKMIHENPACYMHIKE